MIYDLDVFGSAGLSEHLVPPYPTPQSGSMKLYFLMACLLLPSAVSAAKQWRPRFRSRDRAAVAQALR